jgi:hypothetical protein
MSVGVDHPPLLLHLLEPVVIKHAIEQHHAVAFHAQGT